jgi:hypothetical protein
MPKIGNIWNLEGRPIKKNKKNLTQEVAKGKTAVSLTYKPTTKPKVMTHQTFSTAVQELKGAWKVLFNASYKFEIENGADHDSAEFLALRSVHRKMHTAKKVRSTEYGH